MSTSKIEYEKIISGVDNSQEQQRRTMSTSRMEYDAFRTAAIHTGVEPDPQTGAVTVPIYQTSTFALDGVGKNRGWDYSRISNPTRSALESRIAALEGGGFAVATASGMAASVLVVQAMCEPGSHVLIPTNAYGGTWVLFSEIFRRWGVTYEPVEAEDLEKVREALESRKTTMVWVESPTNPVLAVCDIEGIAQLAHEHGAKLCVDNTFASPYLQRPLDLGADVVVHSTTKSISGHSDVIGGTVVVRDPELAETLAFTLGATGVGAAPFDSFLVLRGSTTLAMRMEAMTASAQRIAEFLESHPKVLRVFYPGLESHPQHGVAKRQMNGFGSMVSFVYDGDLDSASALVTRTRLFTLAVSLGGVESLIELPARMTHNSTVDSPLEVDERLIRLSIGCEDTGDLIADLDRALGSN